MKKMITAIIMFFAVLVFSSCSGGGDSKWDLSGHMNVRLNMKSNTAAKTVSKSVSYDTNGKLTYDSIFFGASQVYAYDDALVDQGVLWLPANQYTLGVGSTIAAGDVIYFNNMYPNNQWLQKNGNGVASSTITDAFSVDTLMVTTTMPVPINGFSHSSQSITSADGKIEFYGVRSLGGLSDSFNYVVANVIFSAMDTDNGAYSCRTPTSQFWYNGLIHSSRPECTSAFMTNVVESRTAWTWSLSDFDSTTDYDSRHISTSTNVFEVSNDNDELLAPKLVSIYRKDQARTVTVFANRKDHYAKMAVFGENDQFIRSTFANGGATILIDGETKTFSDLTAKEVQILNLWIQKVTADPTLDVTTADPVNFSSYNTTSGGTSGDARNASIVRIMPMSKLTGSEKTWSLIITENAVIDESKQIPVLPKSTLDLTMTMPEFSGDVRSFTVPVVIQPTTGSSYVATKTYTSTNIELMTASATSDPLGFSMNFIPYVDPTTTE